mmetsp:Transcript_33771/g.77174  ORF Transcript_33771/g.77174 Transcript_33771/m.77174 type:complete len:223 (+) Transcript_33771:1795-2463(+)
MLRRSSAHIVSRGQMHVSIPWHPLLQGISATCALDILAPIGYGAQSVTMHAKNATRLKKKTPCHHFVLGRSDRSSFDPPSFWSKNSYEGSVSLAALDACLRPPKIADVFFPTSARDGRMLGLLDLLPETFFEGLWLRLFLDLWNLRLHRLEMSRLSLPDVPAVSNVRVVRSSAELADVMLEAAPVVSADSSLNAEAFDMRRVGIRLSSSWAGREPTTSATTG